MVTTISKLAGAAPGSLRSLTVAAWLGASLAGALASSASAETLTIALSSTVNTLDPTQAQVVGTDVSVATHLYSPLVARGPDGKLYGVLAESWQPEGDSAWLFNLKPGITFPGGEPLDAEAVKWNIDRIRNPETKSRNRSWFDPVSEVEVVSPTQVRIKTKGPYPTLPDQLSMIFFLSPEWMKTHNPATEAYGTGPYKLKQFVAGDRLILEPNDKAVLEKPTFDEVSMRVIPEASARVAGILAGEIDLAFDLPLEDVERIKKSGRADAGWVPSSRSMVVRMNTLKAPLAGNTKLRQALNYAVDKEGMVEALLGGLGTVSQCQILTPAYFGFNQDLKPYPYDPAKAKQLLKEAGVTTPLKIELEVPLNRYFMASEIGQIVAGQLQEVGVEATIKEMDFGAWVKTYAGRDMGQMALLGQAWPTLDADGMLGLYAAANPTAYFDDKPFDEALKAGRGTTDPAKRLEAYKTATARMCEEAPVIFLFAQPFTYGTSKKITWKARGDDWVRATDVVKK
ncbi:Peptide/nickel transport system substrate-binding protein [Hyphomicrobiales bacterium]|nr:Peptide/nickel transport system substrate-binding protein [Hyphomicrobiales bacterium]CAH1688353.1 Peptide/nickel transport system substrate-binding protein [Hyphomicrobiales bacterium]